MSPGPANSQLDMLDANARPVLLSPYLRRSTSPWASLPQTRQGREDSWCRQGMRSRAETGREHCVAPACSGSGGSHLYPPHPAKVPAPTSTALPLTTDYRPNTLRPRKSEDRDPQRHLSTLAESIDVPQASTWSTSSGLDMRRNSEPGSSSLDLANIPQVTSCNPSTHTRIAVHPSLAQPVPPTLAHKSPYTKTQANNVPGPHIEPLLPTTTSDRAAIAAGAGTQEPSLAFRARNNRWDAADTHRTEGNSQSATATQALALDHKHGNLSSILKSPLCRNRLSPPDIMSGIQYPTSGWTIEFEVQPWRQRLLHFHAPVVYLPLFLCTSHPLSESESPSPSPGPRQSEAIAKPNGHFSSVHKRTRLQRDPTYHPSNAVFPPKVPVCTYSCQTGYCQGHFDDVRPPPSHTYIPRLFDEPSRPSSRIRSGPHPQRYPASMMTIFPPVALACLGHVRALSPPERPEIVGHSRNTNSSTSAGHLQLESLSLADKLRGDGGLCFGITDNRNNIITGIYGTQSPRPDKSATDINVIEISRISNFFLRTPYGDINRSGKPMSNIPSRRKRSNISEPGLGMGVGQNERKCLTSHLSPPARRTHPGQVIKKLAVFPSFWVVTASKETEGVPGCKSQADWPNAPYDPRSPMQVGGADVLLPLSMPPCEVPRDLATVSLPPKSQTERPFEPHTHAPLHLGSQLSPLAFWRLITRLFRLTQYIDVVLNVSWRRKTRLGVLEKPCSHTPGLAEDLIFSLRSRPLYNPNHQTYHHHHHQQQKQQQSPTTCSLQPAHPTAVPQTLHGWVSTPRPRQKRSRPKQPRSDKRDTKPHLQMLVLVSFPKLARPSSVVIYPIRQSGKEDDGAARVHVDTYANPGFFLSPPSFLGPLPHPCFSPGNLHYLLFTSILSKFPKLQGLTPQIVFFFVIVHTPFPPLIVELHDGFQFWIVRSDLFLFIVPEPLDPLREIAWHSPIVSNRVVAGGVLPPFWNVPPGTATGRPVVRSLSSQPYFSVLRCNVWSVGASDSCQFPPSELNVVSSRSLPGRTGSSSWGIVGTETAMFCDAVVGLHRAVKHRTKPLQGLVCVHMEQKSWGKWRERESMLGR
ncbi:uncharacterized protein CLUP02_13658 [Colletotrichum lupini]|uniref:Uncharacterized protein n=1 Tax=Colletotrichum lupini TaxID=145971 RepID=A0A9Q8T4Q7_9PEZI|nr:uncharacterized protein CLUP02_13658 [Colletotrichum lupini]UQC88136.1 hypothetical protein CLUP02_13658 [Colletotrichum lupini]